MDLRALWLRLRLRPCLRLRLGLSLVLGSPFVFLASCAQTAALPSPVIEPSSSVGEAELDPLVPSPPLPCPDEMVLVSGASCPKVRQVCLRWVDPPGPYREFRCAEYQKPSECLAPREAMRFCIDRDEYTSPGERLPLVGQSWTSATRICEAAGKRLCQESEWQFACEGEQMAPYPYGDGFVRDREACNIDQTRLGRPQEGLRDLRVPAGSQPRCASPFGVRDMSGNVEEWTTLDKGRAPERSAMKGAWWLPGKNTCRAVTLGHGEVYRGPQVGVRCCRDVR